MHFANLNSLLTHGRKYFAKGPIALLMIEDEVEIASTIRHLVDSGFVRVIAFAADEITFPDEIGDEIIRVNHDMAAEGALTSAVNAVIAAAPGVWLHYCYNAEYLFYPFSEHRTIGELCSFVTEERRESVLTYVVDLYADNLGRAPSAVSIEDAHLDRTGYYALARTDRWNNPLERQFDFFGGLRWRFEEHVPPRARRIDRVAIFRAKQGLSLLPDHTLSEAEFNTYACPWHHSPTAALCSFRTAKALKRNPGSSFEINGFAWHNSVKFSWHSQQLLNLGLIEPGQWF